MDLDLKRAEHPVGDFSLDLIGKDRATGELVIIENQLEVSDNSHLGQILTYAGGTDPTNEVWSCGGATLQPWSIHIVPGSDPSFAVNYEWTHKNGSRTRRRDHEPVG